MTTTDTHSVTLVTHDATLDDLSLEDYRDMVQELRSTLSLQQMIDTLESQYSRPLWARVEKGEAAPNRNQRNELRRYWKRPLLPPTVAEATAAASPDAAVWQVGEGTPETIVMLPHGDPITLHVNGSVSVVDAQQPAQRRVTGVTRTQRSPRYTTSQMQRRRALGVSWRAVVEAGLTILEQEADNE